VNNTGQGFHGRVASQPMMSSIARIARGSSHIRTVGDKAKDLLEAAKDRISAEIKGQEHCDQLVRQRREHELEDSRRREQIVAKARELIFVWGEGFEQYESEYPLFAQTYQTLINEGIDFSTVTLRPPAMLETPSHSVNLHDHSNSVEEQQIAQAIEESMQADGVAAAATACVGSIDQLMGQAQDSTKLLLEVKHHYTTDGYNGDAENGQDTLDSITQLCNAQQLQLKAAIEVAIQGGEDQNLMSALAANEALQQALQKRVGEQELDEVELDTGTEDTGVDQNVEGIEEIEEYLAEHAQEEEKEDMKAEQKEVDVAAHMLDMDFQDQGNFSKDAAPN